MGNALVSGRPIGTHAMTATERQRRWRAKKRASKPTTVQQLQARIAELEAEREAAQAALEGFGHQLDELVNRVDRHSARSKYKRELERRAKRTPSWVVGYQAACDWIYDHVPDAGATLSKPRRVSPARAGRTQH